MVFVVWQRASNNGVADGVVALVASEVVATFWIVSQSARDVNRDRDVNHDRVNRELIIDSSIKK